MEGRPGQLPPGPASVRGCVMPELLTPFLSYRAAPDAYGKGSTSAHLPGDTKGRGSVVRAAWPRSPRAAEARELTTPRAQSSAWSGPGG